MTIARAHLVDPAVTRRYHCLTRCVGRSPLIRPSGTFSPRGEGDGPRPRHVGRSAQG
jgi:hypothetical protein